MNTHLIQSEVLVIGGGISGLATAYQLQKQGRDVRVLESREIPGGNIGSLARDGWLVENGPNSTLENDPALTELIDELGLRPQVVEASDAANRRYVVKHGKVLPLPSSPIDLLSSKLFSAKDILGLIKEPFIKPAQTEESIHQFVLRRLGQNFLDWAIDPFVSGVYAGDPRSLSIRAATPKVYALEAEYGSLIRGAIKRMWQKRRESNAGDAQQTTGLQTMPSGKMISFQNGMGSLTLTLASRLGDKLHTGTPVRQIQQEGGEWEARTASGQVFRAPRIVLATPANVSALLLKWVDPTLSDLLDQIIYPPVTSVALGFKRDQVGHPLDGFGVLIPSKEQRPTLGALFNSTLFPGRAPEGHVLLTAFIGGRRNPETTLGGEKAVLNRVMTDLSELLNIRGEPVMVRQTAWPHAIPQYELGYLERLTKIDQRLTKLPGLSMRANWRDGISVVDCVKNAKAFAARF